MDDQLIAVVLEWAKSAMADSVGIAVGIWLATEMLSSWNKVDSRKTSVILAVLLGGLGWIGGYWGEHQWFEAILLTCFAWWLASKFHNMIGYSLTQAVINPSSMIVEPPKSKTLDAPDDQKVTTVTITDGVTEVKKE